VSHFIIKEILYFLDITDIFLRIRRRQDSRNWDLGLHSNFVLYKEDLLIPSLENMSGFTREKKWILVVKGSFFDGSRELIYCLDNTVTFVFIKRAYSQCFELFSSNAKLPLN